MSASKKIQAETWQIHGVLDRLKSIEGHAESIEQAREYLVKTIELLSDTGEEIARQEAGKRYRKQLEFKFDA